jgi:hypothetical protein
MDAKSKRGCLWAALGAGVLVLIVGAALLGGTAWLVYQSSSIQSEPTTPERARDELQAVLDRYAGQPPLIAIDEHDRATLVPRTQRSEGASPTYLHVVAFDPTDNHLKRVRLPFWLLRLSPAGGELKLGDDVLQNVRGTRLTIKDVEDAGPGLLLDHAGRDGRRILVWTE